MNRFAGVFIFVLVLTIGLTIFFGLPKIQFTPGVSGSATLVGQGRCDFSIIDGSGQTIQGDVCPAVPANNRVQCCLPGEECLSGIVKRGFSLTFPRGVSTTEYICCPDGYTAQAQSMFLVGPLILRCVPASCGDNQFRCGDTCCDNYAEYTPNGGQVKQGCGIVQGLATVGPLTNSMPLGVGYCRSFQNELCPPKTSKCTYRTGRDTVLFGGCCANDTEKGNVEACVNVSASVGMLGGTAVYCSATQCPEGKEICLAEAGIPGTSIILNKKLCCPTGKGCTLNLNFEPYCLP